MRPSDRASDPSGDQPRAESIERRTLLKGLATGLAGSLAVDCTRGGFGARTRTGWPRGGTGAGF